MSFPEQLHLKFHQNGQSFNLNLVRGNKSPNSDRSILINGVSYCVLGDEAAIPQACRILNQLSLSEVHSMEELVQKIENLTDKDIPESKIALSILKPGISEIVKGEIGAQIDDYLRSITENTFFRGSVVVLKAGETLLSKGYGMATATQCNTSSTVFHIGSLTKQFTAAGIMKLSERGVIDVNGKINQYLPEKFQSEFWGDVSVKELLSHTSGLSNYTDDPEYFKKCRSLTKEMLIQEASQSPLKYPSGEYHYSNTGYLLLGALIEQQAGMSYGEFIKKVIFEPAGMHDSGVHDKSFQQKSSMAIGFCPDQSGERLVEDMTEDLSRTCGADGSIFSSLQDLVKWSQVMDDGRGVLTQASVEQMKTPVANGYGYGLAIEQKLGTLCISHDGLVPGFSSSLVWLPEQNLTVAVLGNNGEFPSRFIADAILDRLLDKRGESLTIIPHHFGGDSRLGNYTSIQGDVRMEFFEKGGKLFVKGIDGPEEATECYLLSNQRILHAKKGLMFEFNDGQVVVSLTGAMSDENPDGVVDRLVRHFQSS